MSDARKSAQAAVLCALTALLGCVSVNAPTCSEEVPCERGVCQAGHCLSECALDPECSEGQVCRDERCVPPPQCDAATDCAVGFQCTDAQCRCASDSACALNEACIAGACRDRPACEGDADCAEFGLRCERSQGLCVPPCTTAQQCAPGVDANLALALYACEAGTCFQRCVNDGSCGGGLICLEGLCTAPECFSRADCAPEAYCTRATGGQCLPYRACTEDSQCPENFGCSAFPAGECPPEVDCAATVCRENPLCAIDQDCAPPAFCGDGHCQPTVSCDGATPCPPGRDCVGGTCVPHVCRGHADCPSGEWCSDGACRPTVLTPAALSLFADARVVQMGDSLPLSLVGFAAGALGGTPLANATWEITDETGAPTARATVDDTNLLTAVAAGPIQLRATVAGATVSSNPLSLEVVAAPGEGETRVVVMDAATLQPLQGVRVLGCEAPPADGPCAVPLELLTDASGSVLFPFASASAAFSASSSALRGDGFPAWDRASIPRTSARTVILPLRPNRLHADAALTFGFSLQSAPGDGAWWVGLPIASLPSVHEAEPRQLLGEPFVVRMPGVNASATVPGALTLSFEAQGFGGPIPLKERSRVIATAGERGVIGFGGRIDVPLASAFGGTSLLQYLGGLGAALAAPFAVSHGPHVPDVGDLDGDGLCPDPGVCPSGSEDRPAYPGTNNRVFGSFRPQPLRTEIAPPPLPDGLSTALVLQVQQRAGSGLLPFGLSSRTAGVAAPDGTRPVAPIVLRSATPAAGYEAATPGTLVIATNLDANGLPQGSFSLRQTRGPRLDETVSPPALLPLPRLGVFEQTARRWTADPASRAVLGAVAYRVVLQGPDSAHVVHLPLEWASDPVRVPETPAGAGTDAASSSLSSLTEETAIELSFGNTFDDAFDLRGPSWARPSELTSAASTRR